MSTYITKRARELKLRKIDARTPLRIEVRANDVQKAKQKNSKCCAFAKAAQRLPDVKAAYFFLSTAWLEYDDKLVRYSLPPSMQKEIVSFDRSKVMAPGVYQVVPPSKTARMSEIKKRSAKRPGRHQPGNGKIKRGIRNYTQLVRSTLEPAAA